MQSDYLIVGSGIAGLFLAEKLSKLGSVTLVTKAALSNSNTNLAQGGIAAVRNFEHDSIEDHLKDTLEAGAHHNNVEAVEFLVKNADRALNELSQMGVDFDKTPTQEGGHSFPRIWHKDDFSGEYIAEALIRRVQKNAKVNIWDRASVFDLMVRENTCYGVMVQDHNKQIHKLASQHTILACGGAGYLFEKTTNPDVTVGDGIALAVRHNVELRDLEFIQFHPTGLDLEREPMFLLSEALRGEGAKLVNSKGDRFMQNYHPLEDLAPRDIVTRAIRQEQETGPVFLDVTHKSAKYLRLRFPNIAHELRKYDLKLERDLIPITPAAHYTCGGIVTNLTGETSLKNLFAIGEIACTGVQGANRLASNSLLEGVVFAMSYFEAMKKKKSLSPASSREFEQDLFGIGNQKLPITSENYPKFLAEIKKIMWKHFGIIRQTEVMQNGLSKLQSLVPQDVHSQNVKLTAMSIAEACLNRKESLGCHWVE